MCIVLSQELRFYKKHTETETTEETVASSPHFRLALVYRLSGMMGEITGTIKTVVFICILWGASEGGGQEFTQVKYV